ncbi:MAG: glycerol-3-phosphate O-acyltransferase/dihydroxyacetone phosphate acyltransferase [Crocinitomix sp.]|jgi:glycerol-3-phosphate O-acyltransferase/dihydroxyacetone phosphate acyltransferase
MIYAILKILSRLTIWGYFRKVKIVGRERIPKTGPYLFVANHPSAFMDPIVVATSIRPPVYFIAAGEYVGTGIKGWFFKKSLHSIPVYRPSTRPEDAHKNKDMFVKCYEHLTKKGALLIFPEGVSLTEKKLKPLKTGTVRIAIGAEELHAFELGVPIIPIGLNYSDPHSFRSDLFVKIGAPIYVNELLDETKRSDKEYQIAKTREITALLQEKMQATILHLDSEEEEELLEKLETIFYREVKKQLGVKYSDQEGEFRIQKDFIAAIKHFKINDSELFEATEEKVDQYIAQLSKHNISDKDIGEFGKRFRFKRVGTYILGLPFFIFGLIHNILPYKLVGILTRNIKMEVTFAGSMSLAIGLGSFLLWYIGISITLGKLYLGWWALLYPVLMYVTGLYALLYSTAIQNSKQRKNLRKLAKTNRSKLSTLVKLRADIIAIFMNWQKEYSTHFLEH